MSNKKILITLGVIIIFLLVITMIPHNSTQDKTEEVYIDNTPLNISNLTYEVTFERNHDQFGDIVTTTYKYHAHAEIYNKSYTQHYSAHIKAYDSNWNYIDFLSKNVTLSSLDQDFDGSNPPNIDYRYFNDTLIDYKYAIFEIYDDNGHLLYNQTAIFDLENVKTMDRLDFRTYY